MNIHPGEILQLEFLEPMNITPYRLSKDIGVTQTRISEILSGKTQHYSRYSFAFIALLRQQRSILA